VDINEAQEIIGWFEQRRRTKPRRGEGRARQRKSEAAQKAKTRQERKDKGLLGNLTDPLSRR
jgi:hypothetical protein